jgi:DNA-binding NarL/FixJ family response regulator
MSGPIKNRIVVIEPSPALRRGVKALLEEADAFAAVDLYADLPSFHNRRERKSFDVLLINPSVVQPHKSFVARNVLPEPSDVLVVALHSGYVDAETLASFDGVLGLYDDGPTMRKKLERMARAALNRTEPQTANIDLSEREKEILISIANGLTNKEIADKHFISIHTVVSHRKNITRKIGIKTVSGLTIYAVLNNLIS